MHFISAGYTNACLYNLFGVDTPIILAQDGRLALVAHKIIILRNSVAQ